MNETVFRDVLMLLVLGFVAVVAVLLPHINDPEEESRVVPPGNVMAYIVWPAGDVDVDLWVTGPGETVPVGYSHPGGALWNLLRDDTGGNDVTGLNYENAYTRGVPPGRYTVNVHCYSCDDAVLPVRVRAEIRIRSKGTVTEIVTTSVELKTDKQELTVLDFEVDDEARIINGSENSAIRPLRSQASQPGY